MFERFTNQSRYAIVAAQEEARSLDHDYIGSEHLLLGLLREDQGTSARALASAGITLEAGRPPRGTTHRRGGGPPAGANGRRPGISRSRGRPRNVWSSRCGKPCSWAIATSAAGISCSG